MSGSNRYWDVRDKAFVVQILPGELHVTAEDEIIVTMLGSCVAICARDRDAGIGGLNHYMLPGQPEDGSASPRYGQPACQQLLEQMTKLGARRERIEVHVFGGGAVIDSTLQIGTMNVDFAKKFFGELAIPIRGEDVGDQYARRVRFRPRTGLVQCKGLPRRETSEVIQGEKALRESLAKLPFGRPPTRK
jgi:chemotaxis protein CheD